MSSWHFLTTTVKSGLPVGLDSRQMPPTRLWSPGDLGEATGAGCPTELKGNAQSELLFIVIHQTTFLECQ